jgi:hypothetical protein
MFQWLRIMRGGKSQGQKGSSLHDEYGHDGYDWEILECWVM